MKLFGFLIRIVLLIALVVWLADRPGTAQIVWRDYVIETSAAVLAVIIAAIAYIAFLLHRVWRFVIDGPYIWSLKRKLGKVEDGQKELVRGLAAIAVGQAPEAGKHAVKARKLLGESAATQLLLAQSAQLSGDHRTAKSLYEAMTKDNDAAPLGYRGLIMAALRSGDYEEVSRLGIRLEALKGEVPWLHLVRFEVATRYENWSLAADSLQKARRGKALAAPLANKHEAALLLADAKAALRDAIPMRALELAEKARKLTPDWTPSALILAETQIVTKHERAALRTIEKAWERAPNPQLIPLLHWAMEGGSTLAHYKYIERMTRHMQNLLVSRHALAEAALKADLWGEARRHLMLLVNRGDATQMTYQMLARLELRELRNEKAASAWTAKAVIAPSDAMWLCTACGAAHEYWEATCRACGSFNTMDWGVPGKGHQTAKKAAPQIMMDYLS